MLGAAQASRQTDYYLIYHLMLPLCLPARGPRAASCNQPVIGRGAPSPSRPTVPSCFSFLLFRFKTKPLVHSVTRTRCWLRTSPSQLQEHIPTARGREAGTPAEPSVGAGLPVATGRFPLPWPQRRHNLTLRMAAVGTLC